jgi:hypothetical protein
MRGRDALSTAAEKTALQMTMIEQSVYQAIRTAVDAAPEGSALHGAEVYATEFERINAPFGFQVGDAECEFAPRPSGEIEEYNAALNIKAFVRVGEATPQTLVERRTRLAELMTALAQVFQNDQSLGNTVCQARVVNGKRGWGKVETIRYAVGVVALRVNEK